MVRIHDGGPSRPARRRATHASPRVVAGIVAVLVLGVLGVVVGAWAISSARQVDPPAPAVALAASEATSSVAAPTSVEVPDLVGLSLAEAETILSAAGLAVQVKTESGSGTGGEDRVVAQDPATGVVAEAGATVVLTLEAVAAPAPKAVAMSEVESKQPDRWVVCIDPGHQARSDSSPEAIGPGAEKTKPAVTGGATGVKTRVPEYEIALQISMNLKKRLEDAGVEVVMTRTTNDVNLSNAQRAAIANEADADLFVRIHGDGSPDSETAGLSTLYPGTNRWTKPIVSKSKRAARYVHEATVLSTGALDRGIKPRTDLSGFNWAKVPSILVETGFLSNPVEDRLLASPHYQDKLAAGIADGVLAYLKQAQ